MASSSSEMTGGSDPAPVKLFRGYDTVARGILTASAVVGDYENTGVSSGVRVQVCESLTELAEALDIDASLSVSYLKAVDVTAKMEFARKLNVTARSVTIVVYAKHGLGTWDATERKLKGGVKAPTDDKSAASFVKTYGDSFIRSVTLGGEYSPSTSSTPRPASSSKSGDVAQGRGHWRRRDGQGRRTGQAEQFPQDHKDELDPEAGHDGYQESGIPRSGQAYSVRVGLLETSA